MSAQPETFSLSPELTVHRDPAGKMVAMPQREAVPETPRNAGKTKADVIAEIQDDALRAKEAARKTHAKALRLNPKANPRSLEKIISAIDGHATAAISEIHSATDAGCAPHMLSAQHANYKFSLPSGLEAETHGHDTHHHDDEHKEHDHDNHLHKGAAHDASATGGMVINGQFFSAAQIAGLIAAGVITTAALSQMGGVVVSAGGLGASGISISDASFNDIFTNSGMHADDTPGKPVFRNVELYCGKDAAERAAKEYANMHVHEDISHVDEEEKRRAKAAEHQHETQV